MSIKSKIEIAEWTIKETINAGANEASATVSNRREVEIEFRDKKLEKLSESTKNSLKLAIYSNYRYSSHTTNDLRKESLQKFISEAVAATKYLSRDDFRSLPDSKYYPKDNDMNLQILDKNHEKVETSERVKLAREIESAAMEVSDQIISSTAGCGDVYYETAKVHSNGFSGENQGTIFYAGAEVTVKDGESGRPADWYYGSTRYLEDLPSPDFLGKEAARRALRKVGQKKIDSGQYAMIVENRSGSRLLSMLQGPMSARSLQQKSSFLEGKLGKKIASEKFSVIDNPFLEKGLGSRLFDNEGIAAKKRYMIEKGILRNYYVDNYYGRKLGMAPTSGSSSNIIFDYGSRSCEELIKDLKKGIFVTGFIGGNSNSTTGDFSFGVVGLLIENGELVQPVNEMNISGNAQDFWKNLVEVGNDPYIYSSRRMPSLMFEGVQFSGL
ncbi:Metalloprotease PmbA [subsurface metagenome]